VIERSPGRTRPPPALEIATPGHMFARFALRPWGLEPTVRRRDRSIEPVTRHRQAATLLASAFAKRPPADRQPRPGRVKGATPPNPVGTCCPRPLSAAPRASRALLPCAARKGRRTAGPQRRSFSVCQWTHPSPGGSTLVGFCPSSNKLVSPSYGDAWLRRPSTLRPTGGSPRGGRSVTGTPSAPPRVVPSLS
jgi:hypothetical protein